MSVFGVVRRVRAYGGHFLLLAVLTLVTALLITAVPRIADRLTGQGLREHVAAQPVASRDVLYSTAEEQVRGTSRAVAAPRAGELDTLQQRMPPAVRQSVGERWYAARTGFTRLSGPDLTADKGLIDLSVRTLGGVREAAGLVEGRWPETGVTGDGAVEVALAETVAGPLGLRAGSRLRLSVLGPDRKPLTARKIVLVGVFRPTDQSAGVWDALPSMLRLAAPTGDGEPFLGVGVTADAGFDALAGAGWPVSFAWRYRISPDRITPGRLGELIDGLATLDRTRPAGLILTQGVDIPLRRFAESLAAARTLLAVIAAGLLATLAGLTVLAARLAARRRRAEYVLLRARGGSTGAVLGR
ncbi:hypothetical protein JNW87_29485, partial [Micromonospora sp. ATA51]|nr:hypothetical protein [Micromonospora sp. ATA51]